MSSSRIRRAKRAATFPNTTIPDEIRPSIIEIDADRARHILRRRDDYRPLPLNSIEIAYLTHRIPETNTILIARAKAAEAAQKEA